MTLSSQRSVMTLLDGVWLLLVSLLVALWWKYGWSSSSNGMPPGPTFLQTYTSVTKDLKKYQYKVLATIGKKYGGLFTLRIFGQNFVVINDWKMMKDALVGQSEVFSGRPDMYLANKMLQNTDILFVDGTALKEKRRFVLHHLRNFGFGKTSMETIILNEMSKLMDAIEQEGCNKKLLVNGLFFLPVLNILFGVIAGKQYDYEDKEIQKFSKTLKDLFIYCHGSIEINFFPYMRFLPFYGNCLKMALKKYDEFKMFLNDEIDRHLESKVIDPEPRDFIDAYLAEMQKRAKPEVKTINSYSRSHLIGITFDLLQAGIETTVSTLEWTLLYMALWPEIQETVQDELDRVVGRNRLPNYGDHSLMPYLEATILEIHRYSTVVPMSGPHSTMSATKLAGFTIPQRTTVFQNIWAVHYDHILWGDPEVFRPERFINNNGNVEKPDYLIPFSLGARKCIGESLARIELFLFIACLLQRFSFRYASGEPPPTLEAKPLQTRGLETRYLIAIKRLET